MTSAEINQLYAVKHACTRVISAVEAITLTNNPAPALTAALAVEVAKLEAALGV